MFTKSTLILVATATALGFGRLAAAGTPDPLERQLSITDGYAEPATAPEVREAIAQAPQIVAEAERKQRQSDGG